MVKMRKGLVVIVLAAGIAGVLMLLLLSGNKNTASLVELNASVVYDGTCIIVRNNDSVDYLDAQLTLNGYYSITGMNLQAGETYRFWPAEFAHVNRRRFPARQVPRQLAINCRLIEDRSGFFSKKLVKKK